MNSIHPLIRANAAIPFFSGNRALNPLTCEIETASVVCFLGQRLSILNIYLCLLAGLSQPQSGSIDYFIEPQIPPTPLDFPTIAYISHDCALLSILNGIDNVRLPALYHQLGTKSQIDAQANALLNELQYDADHTLLPAFMSLLQKRHLLIARALMLNPKIVFIENPFAGLDLEETEILGEYLVALVKNKSISLIVSNATLNFVTHYATQIIYVTEQSFHFFTQWQTFLAYQQLNQLKL